MEEENADLCAWNFGTPNSYTYPDGRKVFYNAVLSGHPYLIQLNWDPSLVSSTNATKQTGCVYGVDKSSAAMRYQPPKLSCAT